MLGPTPILLFWCNSGVTGDQCPQAGTAAPMMGEGYLEHPNTPSLCPGRKQSPSPLQYAPLCQWQWPAPLPLQHLLCPHQS